MVVRERLLVGGEETSRGSGIGKGRVRGLGVLGREIFVLGSSYIGII